MTYQTTEPLKRRIRIFALKEDDVKRLLNVTVIGKYKVLQKSNRNKLLVRLLLVTGLRVAELAALKVEDIDFQEGAIYVWCGKGKKQRTVLADSETLELLRKYCQNKDLKQSLIGLHTRMISKVVKQHAVTAGVKWAEYVSPHRLRDTFAVQWVKHQGDLESLRRLLGHSSLAMTQKYLVFEFDQVRATYDRIFGKKQDRRLYG